MLRVRDLRAGYNGIDVIKDISFSLSSSESLCIVGPNGCGKTTLLRAISGLIPSRGVIELDNQPIQELGRKGVGRKIALMSQLTSLYFSYTVFETVMMGRYLHMKGGVFSGPSKADVDSVEECLRAVKLTAQRDKEITALSGGQLQRMLLARVLAQEPQLILLDEPTNHLDLRYQTELMDYLREWASYKDHAVIGVLHDLNLAMSLADNILLMDGGHIAAHGSASDVLRGPLLREVYGMDVAGYMKSSLNRWESLG